MAEGPPQASPTQTIVIDSAPSIAAAALKIEAITSSVTPQPSAPATAAKPLPPKLTSAVPDSVAVPQVVAAVVQPSTPAPTSGLQGGSGAQVTDSSASGQPVKSQWKDGVYSGWGTSRHGDIQATVEVREGRIISAAISQCRTRYSCSWIAHLPGQVVSRQSAEVDYVSGATQSTDAFYYAVVDALTKAK